MTVVRPRGSKPIRVSGIKEVPRDFRIMSMDDNVVMNLIFAYLVAAGTVLTLVCLVVNNLAVGLPLLGFVMMFIGTRLKQWLFVICGFGSISLLFWPEGLLVALAGYLVTVLIRRWRIRR